jgi:dienelactone hydrolase
VTLLSSRTADQFKSDGVTHPTYRKGAGPGVVVIHELPGMTPEVIQFAEDVVAAGFSVVMPHLFGTPEAPFNAASLLATGPRVCLNREFNKLALRRTSPVAGWLRSLARELHAELGGPGVGAIGMCFTGGFALAMMVDDSVAAPVVAQPSLPFPIGKARADDLNLSPTDLDAVKARAAGGCSVLGLRYRNDPATGTRFDRLERELGAAFLRVDLDGKGHSTLTAHRQQRAVDRVLEFLTEQLKR